MIRFEHITKRFGKTQALKSVSLELNQGSCIALLGPNGCGKTTLIKSFLGLVIPDSGTIYYKGQSLGKDIKYRNEIGYMPQIGRYPENMTVSHVLETVKYIRGSDVALDLELYQSYKLDGLLNKRMSVLSGGTRQKVSAVLACLFDPRVLILDEPTAGLDPIASEILRDKIKRETKNGKLVLITSHLLSELEDLVTETIFMEEGQVLFHKSVSALLAESGADSFSGAITHVLKAAIK